MPWQKKTSPLWMMLDHSKSEDQQVADYRKSYKRGGKVKKTGKALVHKGERVLTKKQAQKFKSKKR